MFLNILSSAPILGVVGIGPAQINNREAMTALSAGVSLRRNLFR
jgi:hypothetical protein